MKNTLYLECFSGISGDMTVAALLDLGVDEEILLKGLKSLNIDGYKIKIANTSKCGITAKDFDVILDESIAHNEQDYHHHHTHSHQSHQNHEHQNHEHHTHEHHTHEHKNHEHHTHYHDPNHVHRNIDDISEIITNAKITLRAKEIALKIFILIARAEAKVHGKSIEEVHFHEVGAVDSIVDIVATAICIDELNIGQVIVSPLSEGYGHVECQHGIIPVPVPAVVEIAKESGLQLKLTDTLGEMVTPTGAAIVAALKTSDQLPMTYTIKKVGIGAGKKDFPKANILRAFIIDDTVGDSEDNVFYLQCNIDDMTGEEMGFALEIFLEEGALDATFTPIYMKKNRPAYELTVICKAEDSKKFKKLLFKHTTTLGIRAIPLTRTLMKREKIDFQSTLGKVKIKEANYEDIVKKTVEYEDAKRLAKEYDLSISEVLKTIYSEIR